MATTLREMQFTLPLGGRDALPDVVAQRVPAARLERKSAAGDADQDDPAVEEADVLARLDEGRGGGGRR